MSESRGRVPGFDSIELEREHLEAGDAHIREQLRLYEDQDRSFRKRVYEKLCELRPGDAAPLPDAAAHPSIQRPQTDLGE